MSCGISTSLTVLSSRIGAAICAAVAYTLLRLLPLTCTSIGAGSPRLMTASTNPPDWKYVLICGNWCESCSRTRLIYS